MNALSIYVFGPFQVDTNSLQLTRSGETVAVSPKVFDTLVLLLRNRHRVVSKEELFREVWGEVSVSEDSLTQTISALRRALGDDRMHAEYIATVPRRGYRFLAQLTEVGPLNVDDTASVQAVPSAPVTLHPLPTSVAPLRDAGDRNRWGWAVALAALVVVAAVIVVADRLPKGGDAPGGSTPIYFPLDVPPQVTVMSGGLLSPAGDQVAFVGFDNTAANARIWLRNLSGPGVRPLPGTEDAERPFWSPDGRQIGFFARGKLKVIDTDSQAVQTLATIDGSTASGGTWSPDGTILYGGFRTGLIAINATGGEGRQVTAVNPEKEGAHRRPQFLPGGKRFLYYVQSVDTEEVGTYVGSLDGADRVRIAPMRAVYTDPGYLLYVQDHVLFAQRFDSVSGRSVGEPTHIYDDVTPNAEIYASPEALTFGAVGGGLVWMNRAGETLGALNAPTGLQSPVLSPDGRYVAASSTGAELRGLWLIDLSSGAVTRVINNGHLPIWSPDGTELAYYRETEALGDLYRSPVNQTDTAHLMLRTHRPKLPTDWSPRGVLFTEPNPNSKFDIWMLSADDAQPVPLVQSPFNETQGQWSPDGRWLAFASDESGSWGVYVQLSDTPAIRRAVSSGGGAAPRWRADGRELFYIAPNRMLMSVQVTPGTTWQASRPQPLFRVPIARQLTSRPAFFAVTSDGERFLIAADGTSKPIPVLINWQSLIDR